MIAVILLITASLFAYNSLEHGYWAGFCLAIVAGTLLLVFIGATWGGQTNARPEPQLLTPADPHGTQAYLDQVPIPLVSYSDELGAQAVNRAARSLFQTDDVIRLETHDLLKAMTSALPGGRPNVTIFGRQYAVSVSEILRESGQVRLATLTDVQMEIHKAEATALRDTLHILSHEIMNSLTPVASLADIANSYLEEDDAASIQSAREALGTLSRRALSLTRFIEAYRTVARLPEPRLQPVDLSLLVQDLVRLFSYDAGASGIHFQVEIDEGLPRVNLDEAQSSQAIINVLTNAVEAAEAGDPQRFVRVSLTRWHGSLILEISDSGAGVADHLKPNLFNAFATTKPKGTGTGLNLARQITLGHGGNLRLIEGGRLGATTFAFTFPIDD